MNSEDRMYFLVFEIFERGDKKAPEVDEDTVWVPHVEIGELAVADDFLSRKLKPWICK